MNPQDPLAALQPLREPSAIHWWPPAPGWWVLAALLIAFIAALVYWMIARRRATQYRRQGLEQLERLQAAFDRHQDASQLATDINALLKSVALRAYPGEPVSPQHGNDWVAFLNARVTVRTPDQRFAPDCFNSIYQREADIENSEQLAAAARYWIKHHRPTR